MVIKLMKNLASCIRELNVVNGKVTMKFKNSKKCQNAQGIIDSIKLNKIVIK